MTEETNTNDAAKEAAAKEAAAKKAAAAEAKKAAAVEAKAKREADKAEKKAAKDKAKADKLAAKAASKQPEQNGIRRPKEGTTCGKVWAIFDKLSADSGKPATIGDSLKAADGMADATVRTQYARWRKFHGITGRQEPAAKGSEGQGAAV
jgi:ATPase subunit of ABC transporter with duplicated ATPase domains